MFDTLFLLLSYVLADNLHLFFNGAQLNASPIAYICTILLLYVLLDSLERYFGPCFYVAIKSEDACPPAGISTHSTRTDKYFLFFSNFRKLTENLRNSFWCFPFQKPLFSLCTSNKSFGFSLYFLSLKLHLFI